MEKRIHTLDVYRIAIVLFIFLFHSNIHLGINYKFLTPFISQSAIFMAAFFILSGFSLYYSYHDRDLSDIKDIKIFYAKRLIRIYPIYLFIYAVFIVFYNTLTFKQNMIIAPIELLLLQSFFDGLSSISHNGGTWFLSCILFCYLLFPWLKEIMRNWKTKKLIILCFLYLLTFLSPIIVKTFQISSLYTNPFFRLLEFIIGMIVADFVLKNRDKVKKHTNVLILLEVLILFFGVTILAENSYFKNDYTMYNIISVPLFAALIYSISMSECKPFLWISGNLIVQYLSKISLAFFMAQFFSFKITKCFLDSSWFSSHTNTKMLLISFLINSLLAVLMYEVIENPFSKILTKRLIQKSPTK